MDDTPISLEVILEQAPRWTFAGDVTLLQWMKQISKDLENRATNTSNALDKLNHNIKSTNIALDNVANSLTALQFGNQFVESRVQDDDETLASATEPIMNDETPTEELTSEEILKEVINNNLKVLRNCHEKYFIDLEDSDDEENPKEKTCIYRPINPYNERPLPYIIGSKEWHSNWHVGVCENQQENANSGDEISETFSESSSTSHVDDNESFESNTEWASSNSVDNDNFNANIEVKNASSIRGSQSLHPETLVNINVAKTKAAISESSSISTTSSSFAKKSLQTAKQTESLTQRSESINSISSKSSSKTTAKVPSDSRENVSQYKSQTRPFVDLFAEPPEDPECISSSSVSSYSSNRIRVSEDNRSIRRENTSVLKTQPPPFVDLFADPPEDVPSPGASSMFSNQNTKRKIVNLFDDDDKNMASDDLLSVLRNDEQLEKPEIEQKSIVKNKPSVVKTSTSLFDDSDDDDDFLKAFLKKPSPKDATKSSLAKTLLFDNESHEPEIKSKLPQTDSNSANNDASIINIIPKNNYSHKKTKNIFDDSEDNEDDLLFSSKKIEETKIPTQREDVSQLNKTSVSDENLFNKPVIMENVKDSANEFNDLNNDSKADNIKSLRISKKINLFDDLDEEGDLFSTQLKKNEDISQQTAIRDDTNESEEISTLTKEIDVNKLNEMKSNNSILNKERCEPKAVARNYDDIPQKRSLESAENEAATESLHADKNLLAKDKLSELPGKEELKQPLKELDSNKHAELTQETLATAPEDVTQKPNSSNKYDFSSVLFSDEPPDDDDDEFFETLAKTPSILNRNYSGIDLENDIYEPELPKVPAANISNNPTDTTDNFYTGLQLFSDIPPDDDAGSIPDVNQTKRLHSVFYDDFNETLMALNQQHGEKEVPSHSIFSDEPPPMNEVSNSFNKDVTDHKVPGDKQEIISVAHETKTLETSDKNTSEFSNSRPVSKLQMPNININVQALLPGNTLRKAKEDNLKSNVIKDDIKPDLNIQKDILDENNVINSKLHISEVHRTAETEHILRNITKTRVKAPASRRPSTRRARQENYRKSLIEQQQQSLDSETEHDTTKTIIPQGSSLQKELKNKLEDKKQNTIDKLNDNFNRNNISNVTSSTENKHQDDPQIRQDISTKNNDANSNNSNKKAKTKIETDSLLFGDEEEDDDDFFKHIKNSNILDSKATKATADSENITTKSSLEKSEGINTNIQITQDSRKSPLLSEACSNEVAPREIITKEYEKNQATSITGTSKSYTSNQLHKRQFKSFLDSDDDDNDLFKNSVQQPTYSTMNKDKNSLAKSQFQSFLDSETDEESNVAGLQTKTTTSEQSKKISTEIPKVSMRTTKDTKAKLFSDSETDSDDLFGKLSSTKNSNIKTSSTETSNTKTLTEPALKTQTNDQPQSSLFDSDDSDSNDFLASSASFSKTTTSKGALKKTVPKVTTEKNSSLFSDLDSDEDDLFGGATAKVRTINVTNIKNVKAASTSKSTAAEISKSKTADDNPLADLL